MDATVLEWWEVTVRIAAAGFLGGLIGTEREIDGQDAGFRTHLLLALGTALFGVVSIGAFNDFVTERADTNVQVDVTRIASYVAAGVGFIGGGAIIKSGGTVKGITTAASLWTTAAVGLAAGLGLWSGAIAATVFALVALAGLKPISRWFRHRFLGDDAMAVVLRPGADVASLVADLQTEAGPRLREVVIGASPDSTNVEVHARFWNRLDPDLSLPLLQRLQARDDVVTLRVGG
jgi:putative Mg2+ transporter-C (MgtC) family protein